MIKGLKHIPDEVLCPRCAGFGKVLKVLPLETVIARDSHPGNLISVPCEKCEATGRRVLPTSELQ